MTYAELKHRIECVASGWTVIAAALLAVAAVCTAFYGVAWLLDTVIGLLARVADFGGGYSGKQVGTALLYAIAAVVLVFGWVDILTAIVLMVVPTLLVGGMVWLFAPQELATGVLSAMLLMVGVVTFFAVGTTMMTDFRDNAKAEGSIVHGYVETMRYRWYMLAEYRHVYVLLAFLLAAWTVMATGMTSVGSLPEGAKADSYGGFTFLTVLVLHIAACFVAGFGWYMIDGTPPTKNWNRFVALVITSLAPVACGVIASSLYGDTPQVFFGGMMVGCFAYGVLGGIFTCEENLWEILRRKLGSKPAPVQQPVDKPAPDDDGW